MPYFGGKSAIAPLVWARLGDVANYVEPFLGSAAVLLARPDSHKWWGRIETANDADGLLCNLWRAIAHDPEAVASWADWPIHECDLHARHAWLVERKAAITSRLEGAPGWYDAQAAGWWLWGICIWIGSGWCSGEGPWRSVDGELVNVGGPGGIKRQLPHLSNAGQGINRQLPHLSDGGQGINRSTDGDIYAYMERLYERMRRVRVCCGDWRRVLGPTPTTKLGLTGIFLDPPYSHAVRDSELYAVEDDCAAAVREWAIAHGDDPMLRIAVCGYVSEHEFPAGWECVRWRTQGGYSNQAEGGRGGNHALEALWFSPYCLRPTLF